MIQRIFYIFILFIQLQLCQTKSLQKQVDIVYSSLPLKQIGLNEQDGIPTNFQIPTQVNLIFVSLGSRGLMVVDGVTYENIFEFQSNNFLSAVGVTSNAEYVFFSFNKQFSAFKFVNRKQLIYLSSASFSNYIILDIVISKDNKFAFAVGENGKIVAYNIENPEQIELVSQLTTKATLINRINLSFDGQWLFIGDNEQGFTLLKVQYQTINDNLTQKSKQTAKIQIAGNGQAYWKIYECIPTKDLSYVYCTDYWDGIYIAELKDILNAPESSYPINIKFKLKTWPLDDLNPIAFSIKLLEDDQYLMISVRSLGVFIFDITDKEQLILYQKIEVEGQPVQLAISPFDETIIYTNKVSLFIFKQTSPNLNNQQPNLFNGHQSMVIKYYPDVYYRWRCYLSHDDEYLFSAQDFKGLAIFHLKDSDPYQLEFKSLIEAVEPNFVEDATISYKREYIFIAVQEGNCTMQTYDITNINDVRLIDRLEIDEPVQHAEQQVLSEDETILVISYDDGILLVDVSNPHKSKLLSYWKMGDNMIGNLVGSMITKDKKWVLGTVRGYGLFVLDITDTKNPLLVDDINTHGGENIVISPTNKQYAYLVDGYRGVAVVDLHTLPKLSIISRVQLKGWSNDLSVVMNDKYLLVSTMDDGQLTLVDSSNLYQLRIISMFQEGTESSQSSCFTSDVKYAFINNNLGTRIMPLISEIIIHTDISEFQINDSDGSISLTRLQKDQILTVGQNIQMNFIPIYRRKGMIILDILYYSQSKLQMQALPKWMSTTDNNWSLTFKISKESLGADTSTPVENTIVIKSVFEINPEDFIYNENGLVTTRQQANLIYTQLKEEMHYINDKKLITGQFMYSSQVSLKNIGISDEENEILQKKVKIQLQRSVYYNPVIFSTQRSLFFSDKNKTEIITTPSTNIKTILSFINTSDQECIFVNVAYSGCIQELSSEQMTIQITGTKQNINKILQSQLIYYCKKNDTSLSTIQITVEDNLNYDLVKQINIDQAFFLKVLDPITKKSGDLDLQQQFEQQFMKSQIAIETDINFSFEPNYFSQPQQSFLPITYQLFYQSEEDGEYLEATSGYWIKIEKDRLKFFGYPKSTQLNTIEYLKIKATNGYQSSEEIFYISIELISFLYILYMFLRFFGLFLGVFGLYKFKSVIANFILNDKTKYSDEFAIINQPYFKQITIMSDDFEIAYLLFQKYKMNYLAGKVEIQSELPNVVNQKPTEQIPSRKIDQDKEYDNSEQKIINNVDIKNKNNMKCLYNNTQQENNNQNSFSTNNKNNDMSINIDNLDQTNQIYSPNLTYIKRINNQVNNDTSTIKSNDKNSNQIDNQNQSFSLINQSYMNENNSSQQKENMSKLQKPENLNLNNIEYLSSKNIKINGLNDDYEKIGQNILAEVDSQAQNKIHSVNNKQDKKEQSEQQLKIMSYSSNLASLIVNDQKNQKSLKKKAKNVQVILSNTNQTKNNLMIGNFNTEQSKVKQFYTRYINQEGILQFDQLIQDMAHNKIEIFYQKNKYTMDTLKPILQNQNSVFYSCLKSVACRYFLECDKKTHSLYKYLKDYARLSSSFSSNDWYKYYFDIIYSTPSLSSQETINIDDEQEDTRLKYKQSDRSQKNVQDTIIYKNPLPICKLRESVINEIMFNLGIHTSKDQEFDSIIDQSINPYLIRNVLSADAYGFYKSNSLFLLPSLGESIHTYPYQIKQIQGSYLIPKASCFKKNKLSENYEPISLQMSLPQWLSAKVIKNSIIFSGTPRSSDEKVLYIKIINSSYLIVRKFRICLMENENQSFTEFNKKSKIDKVLPVFANYFHDKKSSFRQEELDSDRNTQINQEEKEKRQHIDNLFLFKNNFKQTKISITDPSHHNIFQSEEKVKLDKNQNSSKNQNQAIFTRPKNQSEVDSQISREDKLETILMLENNSPDARLRTFTANPILSFTPQLLAKNRSLNQTQNTDNQSYNQSIIQNKLDFINENDNQNEEKNNISYENQNLS